MVSGPHGPEWGHGRLCNFLDAVEYLTLASLLDAFGTTHGRACWRRLRSALISAIMRDDRPVWVIFPLEEGAPQIVSSAIGVAPMVAHGHPARITNLRPTIARRLEEYRAKAGQEDEPDVVAINRIET